MYKFPDDEHLVIRNMSKKVYLELIKKVCILLVLLSYVYRDERFRLRKTMLLL